MANALVWERGDDLFRGSLSLILLCIFALPLVAGFLTPERPLFTVFVFAFSGGLPLVTDMPAIVIGLWPFYSILVPTYNPTHVSPWMVWLCELPFVLVFTAGAIILMSALYIFPVGIGWFAHQAINLRRRRD